MSNRVFFGLAVLFSCLQMSGATAPDVKRPKPGETVEVLVQYAQKPTSEDHQRVVAHRGKIRSNFENVPVGHYDVTTEALADLEGNPDVVSISPNRTVSADDAYATMSADYNAVANYYNGIGRTMGTGLGIAIIDSGIDSSHPDFTRLFSSTTRIVYSQSFVGGDTGDEYGHGTHVAGIAAGADNVTAGVSNVSMSFYGVAIDANLINLKALDGTGGGTDANVIAAIDRAIALKNTYNIRVINLSLGRPVTTSYKLDPLCQAVESAWKAGIVVVVAAGNDGRDNSKGTHGYGTINAPGNDPYVITVGASNDKGDYDRTDDVITTYSSKGPTVIDHIVKPDLVAPGNRVVSYQSAGAYLPTQYPGNQIPVDSLYCRRFFSLFALLPDAVGHQHGDPVGGRCRSHVDRRKSRDHPRPDKSQTDEDRMARIPGHHVDYRHQCGRKHHHLHRQQRYLHHRRGPDRCLGGVQQHRRSQRQRGFSIGNAISVRCRPIAAQLHVCRDRYLGQHFIVRHHRDLGIEYQRQHGAVGQHRTVGQHDIIRQHGVVGQHGTVGQYRIMGQLNANRRHHRCGGEHPDFGHWRKLTLLAARRPRATKNNHLFQARMTSSGVIRALLSLVGARCRWTKCPDPAPGRHFIDSLRVVRFAPVR